MTRTAPSSSVHLGRRGKRGPAGQRRRGAPMRRALDRCRGTSGKNAGMSHTPTVTSHRAGPVVTVLINRPDRRNAVDGPTAALLVDAMRAFDADPEAAVAVLAGLGGTF